MAIKYVMSGEAKTLSGIISKDTTGLNTTLADVVETTDPDSRLKSGYLCIAINNKVYGLKATNASEVDLCGNNTAGLRVIHIGTDAPNYKEGVIYWEKTGAIFPVKAEFFSDVDSNLGIGDRAYIKIDSSGVALVKEEVSADFGSSTFTYKPGIVEYCGMDGASLAESNYVFIRIL